MRRFLPLLSIIVILFAVCIPAGICRGNQGEEGFTYKDYGAVLAAYVDDDGLVNYQELKSNRAGLDAFLDQTSRLTPGVYQHWSDSDKIAFWINVYNAQTLEVIIDNYPIHKGKEKGSENPKNSIREIPGAWDRITFKAVGARLTLDRVEHKILRAGFNEPRIHVALVCAARSCPPLRNEPYTGGRLEEQLADQARRFLARTENFRIDIEGGTIYLSSIFEWFGEDFKKAYKDDGKFGKYQQPERAVLSFVHRYINEKQGKSLSSGKFKIKYSDYDWILNESELSGE